MATVKALHTNVLLGIETLVEFLYVVGIIEFKTVYARIWLCFETLGRILIWVGLWLKM